VNDLTLLGALRAIDGVKRCRKSLSCSHFRQSAELNADRQLNTIFTSNGLRSIAGARPETGSPGSPTPQEAQPPLPSLHMVELSKITAADSCVRNQRRPSPAHHSRPWVEAMLRQIRATCGPKTMRGIVLRSGTRINVPPSDSPGQEYTTPSPRRRSHFGHKDCPHKDLRKIVKTQTIFRPRKRFRQSSKVQASQRLSSPRGAGSIHPLKVLALGVLGEIPTCGGIRRLLAKESDARLGPSGDSRKKGRASRSLSTSGA
jgi:hypothetical protein